MKISIIIPILNEAATIGKLLLHLQSSYNKENIAEILIIDGGSTDGSQAIASQYKQVKIINSCKGRAKQMNLGSKLATGDILYFLHADSLPPLHFDQHILNQVAKGNNAGCFRMKFNHQHWWLRLAGWLTKFNCRVCRGGDQSQFITKQLFNEIGGYDETYLIYEDNILISELYRRKEFVVIQEWITTSARRYEVNGIWRLQYHFWTIHLKSFFGASADALYAYYKKHISS